MLATNLLATHEGRRTRAYGFLGLLNPYLYLADTNASLESYGMD